METNTLKPQYIYVKYCFPYPIPRRQNNTWRIFYAAEIRIPT